MTFHFNPDKKYCISVDEIERLRNNNILRNDYVNNVKETIANQLEKILMPKSGIIDGDNLKGLIFPTEGWNFDVFISHSHNNVVQAKKLAAYLSREKNRTPFLDDFIWGSADNLLREIDEKFCMHSTGKSFNYNKRNFSTSHVHTMLSMAIFEMIARCKTFIFIESNDSLDFNALKDENRRTLSPWLYQELQYARMLSIMTKRIINESRMFSIGGQLKISYGVDLDDFKKLTASSLRTIVEL